MPTTALDLPALETRIARIVADTAGLDRLPDPDASLIDLGVDSLDMLDVACAVEAEFALEIEDEDIEAAQTVADLAAAVHRKRQVAA